MGILDISILVFREGLECVLVLAAITANMSGARRVYRVPVGAGVAAGVVATALTWLVAVRAVQALSDSVTALQAQAATGLVAVLVLLLVMNWFFHRVYWTGWISMHSRKKESVLKDEASRRASMRGRTRAWWTLGLLGFSALYREGFEVVLFLQSYRLRLGNRPIVLGMLIGLVFTIAAACITFLANRRLPYRKMLVLTGVLLGIVLIVMAGEQAQEMQLAGWLPVTTLPRLVPLMPSWMGTWFSVFPTVETLAAQAIAAALVLVSFEVARPRSTAPAAPFADVE